MRIALMGNRGVPARFGGSDTVFEELGKRFVKKGHKVVVYCRKHSSVTTKKYYKRMERVILPSINKFSLDTLSHSLISIFHVLLKNKADVLNFHGVGNALLFPLLKFSRKKVVIVIDGPDWKRPKWNFFAKIILRLSVNFAVLFSDKIIIDNIPMQRWLKSKFNINTELIFYGADFNKPKKYPFLNKYGLNGYDYLLFVAMMVPDKGPDIILEAFSYIQTNIKLVMVGDTDYFKGYFNCLRKKYTNDRRIIFTGYQYGNAYKEFMAKAYIYIHPFRSDGTSPSLLQSMAYRNCIIASDLPETSSALSKCGVSFKPGNSKDLKEKIEFLLNNTEAVKHYRKLAFEYAKDNYNWEKITNQYIDVFTRVSSKI